MNTEDESLSTRRKLRTDGVQARARIQSVALRLFVAKGYNGTSVRDIAEAADVNVASIAYYFNDKAGLYRTVLFDIHGEGEGKDILPPDVTDLEFRPALSRFMELYLTPLNQGAAALQSVRLRLRELFEPTGMLEDEDATRKLMLRRLVDLLARELGVCPPDVEIERLAYSIWALILQSYIGHDEMRQATPALFDVPNAVETWIARLTTYALAMVEAERMRRSIEPSNVN
jgi:AcrR family transcriptional regulator